MYRGGKYRAGERTEAKNGNCVMGDGPAEEKAAEKERKKTAG